MNESKIVVSGRQDFMGYNIPIVLGGFGEGKKCICDKTIAEIHGQSDREIRRRIVDNIKRFAEKVDYIDLAQRVGESHTSEMLKSMGYSQQSIVQAAHIYVLSERGYAKLIKIMDTDLAWEIHDKLIDEYFAMREHIQKGKPLPGKAPQRLGETNAAARIIRQTLKEAGMAPQFVAVAVKSLYAPVGVEIPLEGITLNKRLFDATAIARRFGINSENGNPHKHAVSAIIAKLDVLPEEKELAPFQNHDSGHAGTNWQYTESVVDKVGLWLEQNNYPVAIPSGGKTYRVVYCKSIAS